MRRHNLFYSSSYDRGLDILLFMWADIKEKYPDATLHVCYGWDLFDAATRGNPERRAWKKSVQRMMNQKGVVHHGRVGKEKLKKIRKKCGIWAYPTYFTEIFCISAVECQQDGVVPVTMDLAALDETVGSGVKVSGNINNPEVQEKYLKQLFRIMDDRKLWKKESRRAKKWAKKYKWEKIAKKWQKTIASPISTPKVSVITISIREGWWNIMARNLATQTYQPYEWIVVDDYKKDRKSTAEKYAQKYDLNIKYVRGDKVTGKYKRPYGLVRANNMGWKESEGELTVWLQDHILIPERGIEWLVDIYRHNKDALLAPTDVRYKAKPPDRENKEDWWNGDPNPLILKDWENVRNKNQGIRETDNPFDFEMNYSAIPKKILDDLNGWWEFFDDGLGFDNTEIAWRAIKKGYRILVDDTNTAKCVNLWEFIKGEDQNVKNREFVLNTPRWRWFETANLPIKRDEKIDNRINLEFKVPEKIKEEEAHIWIEENAKKIAEKWGDING